MQDGAESSGWNLQSAAGGEIDEMGFVIVEILKLIERVAVEQAGQDGKKVEAFAIEIDAHRKGEPSAGGGFERGVEFFVVELMNVKAEVGIDFDRPAFCLEHGRGLGAEPRPVNGGGGEVGFRKPASLGGEFGGLFFGEGKEETVSGICREIGEAELGEFFHRTKLGGLVSGDG